MSDHCIYGPSSLERLDLCPASAELSKLAEDVPGEAAERGTRIHSYAAAMIQGQEPPAGADAEELALAENIRDFAKAWAAEGEELHVEQRLSYSTIEGELYWGTSDLVAVGPDTVRIIDWKTGHREVVEAANNLQGAAYALAAMQTYGKDRAEVTFYNPSIRQLTSHVFTDAGAIANEIFRVIDRAKRADAPCNPSEDACRYCAAKTICPAHMAVCESSCYLVETRAAGDIAQWSDAAVTLWYDRLELAAKWFETRLKPEVIRRAAQGWSGGYGVREQSGGRTAKDICQVAVAVSNVLTQSEILEQCTLSVSGLRTAYAAKRKEAGAVKTKKEGEAEFDTITDGMLVQKEPRKVIYRRKENSDE